MRLHKAYERTKIYQTTLDKLPRALDLTQLGEEKKSYTDLDPEILVMMTNEGLQCTNDITQVAKSLVPRSIKSCLCTPA